MVLFNCDLTIAPFKGFVNTHNEDGVLLRVDSTIIQSVIDSIEPITVESNGAQERTYIGLALFSMPSTIMALSESLRALTVRSRSSSVWAIERTKNLALMVETPR